MPSAADGGAKAVGLDALYRLKSTEPPLYLTPSPELSKAARLASEYLFSSLSPYAPKSPFSQLLTEGFDAEQIWQQIDLQAQPLLSSLRRHVRNFEKNPQEIEKQFNLDIAGGKEENVKEDGEHKENKGEESESEGLDDDDDDDEEEEEKEVEDGKEEEEEEEGDEHDDDNEDEEMEDEERENVNGVEDEFLKIKELEKYLVEDEAREYGLKKEKKNKRKRGETADEDEEGEDEDGSEDEEDEDGEEEDDEVSCKSSKF